MGDRELDDQIIDFLGSIDADFGYAVGNLNMDTTLESRSEIRDKLKIFLLTHLEAAKREAQKELIIWAFQAEAKSGPKFATEPLAVAHRLIERLQELDPEFTVQLQGDGLKKGVPVIIKDKKHKWYGHTGVLGEELAKTPGSAAPRGMYDIELDNGMGAGAYLHQLEKL